MKSKNTLPVLLILLILLCAIVGGIFWALNGYARQVTADFGPPGREMGTTQRLLLTARLISNRKALLEPLQVEGEPMPFEVEQGESVASITTRLQELGLVRSADAVRTYMIYAGLDQSLQAGSYQFSPAMTAVQIAQMMQDATPSEVPFVILPGWRLEEIAASLPTSGLSFSPQTFLKAARRPSEAVMPKGLPELKTLEGFLFPGTYSFNRDVSLTAFLNTLLRAFDEQVTDDLRAGFKRQGLDLQEAVTLASIVQREAILEEEQPQIASVFLNRLNQGKRLESDPTVQYALGYNQEQNTWWTNPLSANDLQDQSPFNTYQVQGLPPAPIAAPGLSALQAVAEPADTPYFFFRAACDGSGRHVFAQTYDEHLNNACP